MSREDDEAIGYGCLFMIVCIALCCVTWTQPKGGEWYKNTMEFAVEAREKPGFGKGRRFARSIGHVLYYSLPYVWNRWAGSTAGLFVVYMIGTGVVGAFKEDDEDVGPRKRRIGTFQK